MVDLKSLESEGPSHLFHAGDYGLTISNGNDPGGMAGAVAEASLVFGLTRGQADSLKLHFNRILGFWQLEYDLPKGRNPPLEIRVIAECFGLTNPEKALRLVEEEALEAGFKMVDFIVKMRSRSDSPLSVVPISQLLES
jgi:hypothetical protein